MTTNDLNVLWKLCEGLVEVVPKLKCRTKDILRCITKYDSLLHKLLAFRVAPAGASLRHVGRRATLSLSKLEECLLCVAS